MLLLIDEGVPSSVAEFLKERGHDVRYVRDLFPGGTPDPVIATVGDKLSAIVVSWDKDFKELVSRVPAGNKQRFKNLGRISFSCREPRGRPMIEKFIEYIEFHYSQTLLNDDHRMIVQIQDNAIKLL